MINTKAHQREYFYPLLHSPPMSGDGAAPKGIKIIKTKNAVYTLILIDLQRRLFLNISKCFIIDNVAILISVISVQSTSKKRMRVINCPLISRRSRWHWEVVPLWMVNQNGIAKPAITNSNKMCL